MRRTVAAALLVPAFLVAMAGPVLAAKPEISTFEFQEEFDIDCGAFALHEVADVTVRQIVWLDDEGNPVRITEHIQFDGLITGPGGIGSLADPGHLTNFIMIGSEGDTVRQVGLIYSFPVPGLGQVGHDVGTITFFPDGSFEYSGPHDVFEEGLEPLICGLFED
jgi:hypothetical protein